MHSSAPESSTYSRSLSPASQATSPPPMSLTTPKTRLNTAEHIFVAVMRRFLLWATLLAIQCTGCKEIF